MGGRATLVLSICVSLLCAALESAPWRYMPAVLGDGYGYIGEASAASSNAFDDATASERALPCSALDLARPRMIQTVAGAASSIAGCVENASAERLQ